MASDKTTNPYFRQDNEELFSIMTTYGYNPLAVNPKSATISNCYHLTLYIISILKKIGWHTLLVSKDIHFISGLGFTARKVFFFGTSKIRCGDTGHSFDGISHPIYFETYSQALYHALKALHDLIFYEYQFDHLLEKSF